MRNVIVVHPDFERVWPYAAEHFRELWTRRSNVEFTRLEPNDNRSLSAVVSDPQTVTRLVSLGVKTDVTRIGRFESLTEAVVYADGYQVDEAAATVTDRDITVYRHESEG